MAFLSKAKEGRARTLCLFACARLSEAFCNLPFELIWSGASNCLFTIWILRVEHASMLQHHLAPLQLTSPIALLFTFPMLLLAASTQHLQQSSSQSRVGRPQEEALQDQGELDWPQHLQVRHSQRSFHLNRRGGQEAAIFAESLQSMQSVLGQILSNQEAVLANQELLIRNQQHLIRRDKYLLSQQELVLPYVRKGEIVDQGFQFGDRKLLEKKILEKEKLKSEKLELGLPDHLQPSRIIISNIRYNIFAPRWDVALVFPFCQAGLWVKGRTGAFSEQHCCWRWGWEKVKVWICMIWKIEKDIYDLKTSQVLQNCPVSIAVRCVCLVKTR